MFGGCDKENTSVHDFSFVSRLQRSLMPCSYASTSSLDSQNPKILRIKSLRISVGKANEI